jgi:ZIP family zinc transporter
MIAFLSSFSPVIQALFATLFTWAVTALGAAFVFVNKTISRRLLVIMLGFAAGVMIAASFFSLLLPAIDMAEASGTPGWLPAVVGFLTGGAFLYGIDKLLPHLHLGLDIDQSEGIKTHWQRSVLLVLAITLHNFPEGLAVGVAFGAVAAGVPSASLTSALALALGIGLQNFPEGMAVSMPLRGEGISSGKAFMLGQASGIVEPIAGVLGALAVITMQSILPYALSFAAGAMIYVVVEELIPESQRGESTDLGTLGAMLGFAVMTFLDVALG